VFAIHVPIVAVHSFVVNGARRVAAIHEILLNVRALASPVELQSVIEREFASLPARLTWTHLQSFRPAAPVPNHK
jgi:hypothetical protein